MNRHLNKKLLPIALLMTFALLMGSVLSVMADGGTGTITVTGIAPTITSIAIVPIGGGSNTTDLSVDTWYDVECVVGDVDLLSDLQRIEVLLYKDGQSIVSPTRNAEKLYGFAWDYATQTQKFQNLDGAGWSDSIDTAYFLSASSVVPTLSGATGTFEFRVLLPSVAHYTNDDGWNARLWIKDKQTNEAWKTHAIDVNIYISVSIPETLAFAASPGDTDSASSNNPAAITYESNCVAKLQVSATTPTNQYGDTFPVGGIEIASTNDGSAGTDLQALTGSAADWSTIDFAVTETASPNSYWFITIADGKPTGTYTFTYTVGIAFDSLAT